MTKPKPKDQHRKRGRKPRITPEIPVNSGSAPQVEDTPKAGRPPKLVADEKTVKQISALAMCHCTEVEAAAVLGVHEDTFKAFLAREPEVDELWKYGQANGRANLRKAQYKRAMAGNTEMLKWLGKQTLGQTDKTTVENTGKNGGPILTATAEIADLTKEQRRRVAAMFGDDIGDDD